MQVLITGSAGFIGYHLAKALARQGIATYGIDSINSYYDVSLKKARLKACGIDLSRQEQEYRSTLYPNYTFRQMDLCDKPALDALFASRAFDTVINLAAQAGVRYSLEHPETYIDSNVSGFLHILEGCRHHHIPRLIFASSSSVYGNSTEVPFREDARADHPVSIYAATKKSNELMAYTYSRLYGLQTVGLRFSPFMVPGDARTWHRCFSADLSWKINRSGYSTRDVYPGISHISTILSRDRHDTRPPGLSAGRCPGSTGRHL